MSAGAATEVRGAVRVGRLDRLRQRARSLSASPRWPH